MLSKVFIFIAAIGVILTGHICARPQGGVSDWANVEAIRAQTTVIVETTDGRTVRGKVASVSSDSIELSHDGKLFTMAGSSVRSVYLTRAGSRLKLALYGGLIGGAAGIGVLAIYTVAAKADPLTPIAGIIVGVPVGAVVGAASGGKRRGELIYRAP
jgi:hypothetical protein